MKPQHQATQPLPAPAVQSRRFDLTALIDQWRIRPASPSSPSKPAEPRRRVATTHSLLGLSSPPKSASPRVSLKLIQGGGLQGSGALAGEIDHDRADPINAGSAITDERAAQREMQQQQIAQNKRELLSLARLAYPRGKTLPEGMQIVQRYLELTDISISDFYVVNEAAMMMEKNGDGTVFGHQVIVSVLEKVDTAEDGRVPTIIGKAIGLGIFSATDEAGVPYEQITRVVRMKSLQLRLTAIGRKYLTDAYRLRAKMWQSLAGRTLAGVEALVREEYSDNFPDLLELTEHSVPRVPDISPISQPQEWFPTHWPTRPPAQAKAKPTRRRGTGKQTDQPDEAS